MSALGRLLLLGVQLRSETEYRHQLGPPKSYLAGHTASRRWYDMRAKRIFGPHREEFEARLTLMVCRVPTIFNVQAKTTAVRSSSRRDLSTCR